MTTPLITTPIRVMVVDDQEIVREGIAALLTKRDEVAVVGEASDGVQAVELYRTVRPEVTLMDLRMPGMSGADAIAAIRAEDPGARVIVLTTYDGDEDVHRAVQSGAAGYILKGAPRSELMAAIRTVHEGGRYIPAGVAARLKSRADGPTLTEREVEVLALVARGLTNWEIGRVLCLAEFTVKNHIKKIFHKLDVRDRTQAVIVAIEKGILSRG